MKPSRPFGWDDILTDGLLVFVIAFFVFELSLNAFYATDHATSFIELDYALWSNHSVALGSASSTPPWTVDNFHLNGQNYSALAPGTAIFAFPLTSVAFALAGGYTAYGPALLWSETFVAMAGAVSALLVYEIAKFYFGRSTSILLGLALAFSTIIWPFATYFFQSDVSAMFALLAVYFVLKAGRDPGRGMIPALISGLAIGLAFTVDYVNAILLPVLLIFLFRKKWRTMRAVAAACGSYILGALPGFLIIGAYNAAIFGTPFMTTEQAFLGRSLLGEFTTPVYYGLALDLVSLSRGLFVFCPFTVLGVLGFVDALQDKKNRAEMILFLVVFLGVLLPYSAWYDPTGGLSFGPRFLAAGIPFLLLPAGYIVEQSRGVRRWLIYGTYAAGAIINGMAALVTVVPPSTDFNVSPLVSYIFPNFAAGNFDTWWTSVTGQFWPAGAAFILVLGIALPLAWVEYDRRSHALAGGSRV